jgi:hypothetical protein
MGWKCGSCFTIDRTGPNRQSVFIITFSKLLAKTTDEVKKRCQQMNHYGEMVKKGGMVAGYHNHNEYEVQFA